MSSSQRERIAHRERNPRRSQPGPTIDLTEDLLRPVKSTPRNNVRKSGFVKGNVIDLLSDDEDEAEPVRPKPPGQKAAATAKPATKRKPRPQPRPSGGVIDLNTPSRSPSPATRSENAKIPVKEKTGPSPKQHSSPAAPKSSARKSALNTSTPKASSSSSGLKATLPKKPVPFVPPPPGETDDDSSGSPLPELERVATLIKTSPQSAKKQNTTGEALIAPIPSPFLPKPPSTLPSAGDDDDPSANLPALEPPLPTPNGATASTNPSPKPAEKTDTQQKSVAATKKRSSAPFIVPNFEDSREEFSDDDVPPLEPPPAVPKSTLKAFPRFARPKAQTRSSQKDAATFVVSNFDDFEGGFSDDDVPPLKPSLPKEKPKPKNSPQSARKQKARTPGPAAQSIRRSPSADSVLQDAPPELPDSPEREVDMEDAAEEQRYIEDYNHPRSPSSFPSSKAPVPEDDEDEDDEYVDDVSLDRPVTLDVPLRSLRGRRSPEKSNASTVDSTSPLITRIRQQKEKTEAFRNHVTAQASTEGADAGESSKTQPRRNTSKRDLEEALSQYFEEMKEEHAVMTRYMLQDAQKAVQMAKPIAVDKVSPFAAMLPVNSSPGDPITGATTNKLYSYVSLPPVVTSILTLQTAQKQTTKLLKTTTILNAKTISRNTPRVPRYNSHINIRRNILREDDEKLKFIPFLGEAEGGARRETNFKRLVKELEDAYSPRNSSSSRQSEEAARIRSYLDDWLEELDIQCDQQTLKHYLITQDQYSDELGLHPHNRKRLLKFFGPPSSIDKLNAARMFNEAFDVTSDINLQDVLLPSALLKEMIEALAKTTDIIHDRLGTHTELICLICGAVDCQTHGDYGQEDVELSSLSDDEDPDDRPQETKYVPHPITLDYKNTIRRHRAQLRALPDAAKMSKQRPCTEACYTVFDFSCMEYEWHEDQFAMLPDLMLSWAKTSAQACFIAYEMNVPCWTVYAEIQKYKKEHGGLPEDDDDDDDQIPTGRPEKPNWYDNKRKVLKSEWSDNTKAHLHQERTQAVPVSDTSQDAVLTLTSHSAATEAHVPAHAPVSSPISFASVSAPAPIALVNSQAAPAKAMALHVRRTAVSVSK